MSKIMITGATGQLGSKIIYHLSEAGVSSADIAVMVRHEEQAQKMNARGFRAVLGSYDEPSSLENAFQGVEKLMFISSPDMDNTLRIKQHAAVVFAARNAGVKHIVYTGIAFAESMDIFGIQYLHLATEAMIKTTGIAYTFLRNAFYLENIVDDFLKNAAKTGKLISSTQSGQFNFLLRDELAQAAAKVLSTEGHENKVYELVNENAFNYDQLAAALGSVYNTRVAHENLSPEETLKAYISEGTPEGFAGFNVYGIHLPIAQGQFSKIGSDFNALTGQKPLPLEEALRSLLV